MDQAQNLRNIVNQVQGAGDVGTRVISVTSGKGGVGKTNFVVNLAIWFGRLGKRVTIIDADFGLANIEVLFNIWPKYSFMDVLRGLKSVPEILTEAPFGIKFIPGGTGFKDMADITVDEMSHVLDNLGYLDEISDIILIDTGAGMSRTVTTFVKAANEAVIITTPEPTSISDSYTLIKNVYDAGEARPDIGIVINKAENDDEGEVVYDRLKGVCEKFLNMTPRFIGSLAYDQDLVKAVKEQNPVMISRPSASYSRGMEILGKRILMQDETIGTLPERRGIKAFIMRLIKGNIV